MPLLIPVILWGGAAAGIGGVAYGAYSATEKAARIALIGGAAYFVYTRVLK